jgi:hypothetical protein
MTHIKITIPILLFLFPIDLFSQGLDSIRLSDFKLCVLTIDRLKEIDPELKQVSVEEMEICSDGFLKDSRFENRIGFSTRLYPGLIFQKYAHDSRYIAKLHLTKDFRGYLPDGTFVDLSKLKAKDLIERYPNLEAWITRGCSDYLSFNEDKSFYFFVRLNKEKEPLYPIDKQYYSEQQIEGIDFVANCYTESQKKLKQDKPLYIVDGKEATEDILKKLKPDDIESITVLKDKNAIKKYGDKGKNGVIEVSLKNKPTED